jgi:hypothetical protein
MTHRARNQQLRNIDAARFALIANRSGGILGTLIIMRNESI